MNINQFVNERKEEWQKLERIAEKLRPGSRNRPTREELWDLGKLYTAAVADLSILKASDLARDGSNDVASYLNGLVVRVHGMIYRRPTFHLRSIPRFIAYDFPQAFRATLSSTVVSTAVFVCFALAGFFISLAEPGFIELIVPADIIASVEKGRVWFSDLHSIAPMASSRLMTHNISVTFLMVAAGITFGVGTLYLLALNGILLGAVAALCYRHNLSMALWSFVLPHGSVELTALCIAGGAGLVLGRALVDPGRYRRADALSAAGQYVGRLALGCVPLLVVAGVIEAFVSPSGLPARIKLIFAAVMFAGTLAFLFFSGRIQETAKSGEGDRALGPPDGRRGMTPGGYRIRTPGAHPQRTR